MQKRDQDVRLDFSDLLRLIYMVQLRRTRQVYDTGLRHVLEPFTHERHFHLQN